MMPNKKLTEDEVELIHRVFGGTKIIEDSVYTLQTGGNWMVDIYQTECGNIVTVSEDCAMFCSDIDDWYDSEGVNKPTFHWDEDDEPS